MSDPLGNGTPPGDSLARDPDEFFSETRMSFGDHIEELRRHLWRAIGGLGFCLIIGFVLDGIGYATEWPLFPGAKIGYLRLSYWFASPFVLTEASLNSLQAEEVPESVCKKLSALKDTGFRNPAALEAALAEKLDEDEFKRYKDQILNAAKNPVASPGDKLKFGIGVPLMQIIQSPVEETLTAFYRRQDLNAAKDALKNETPASKANELTPIKLTLSKADLERQGFQLNKDAGEEVELTAKYRPLEWERKQRDAKDVIRPRTLTTLSVQEALVVYFKVCLVSGLVMASPWVFWQIWSFVAAGLYPHEKKLVHVYLPFSLGLFLAGVFLCQFFVMPQAVAAMLWFNEWLGMSPDLRLNEWLSFAIWMPVIFGISFQTPLVMLFTGKLGIADVPFYADKRKYAYFAMCVFAAIITPSPDAITMLMLAVPMCMLYELGIILIRFQPKSEFEDQESETDELVEV